MSVRLLALLALLALVACAEPEPVVFDPPPSWVYEPRLPAWQVGEARGRLGRSQPPQRVHAGGIVGEVRVPLRMPTPWPVPAIGPARVVVYGREGVRPAVELIELDAGKLAWRDTKTCTEPVVGVTDTAIVCGGAAGVRALGLDGKPRWQTDKPYVAMTGARVVVRDGTDAVTLDAADGSEQTRVKPPAVVAIESIVASCGAELFALGRDGRLARVAILAGRPTVTWTFAIGAIGELVDLDACTGEIVLVRAASTLVAIARASGKVTGRVDNARGSWRARDDSDRVEVATTAGVASWPRDLAGGAILLDLPPLGELLDARGDRRLVRATPLTVVLLDRHGIHSYFGLAAMGAVLGGESIAAGSWRGSTGETLRVAGIPARTRRAVRVPVQRGGLALPAELRDLPDVHPLDEQGGIAKPDTGKHAVAAFALDPAQPSTLYAAALESAPDDATTATVASVDLATRTWRWQRTDGCGPGVPIAVAVAGDVVACASRGLTAIVRATSRDGAARWEWETDTIDTIAGGAGLVLVRDADRLVVLDAATGRVRGRFDSEDGAAMRAAAFVVDGQAWLVTYEHGRIVARLPGAGLLAAWSLDVGGVVTELLPSGDGVLVALDDGDAYRVAVRTATVTPLPGIGLAWQASGELVTGHTAGGPIPAGALPRPRPVLPVPVVRPRGPVRPPAAGDRNPDAPSLWIPIPAAPPLGDSWQYTFYELTGGLRARNDYALAAPVMPAPRGPPGSPLVVAYGPGLREAIVLDPRTGDPLRRVVLPEPGLVFGTIVDGSPVAGAVLAAPLRAVIF